MTDKDVAEIKFELAEIKRILKNAGFTGQAPQKVIDIGKKAREIKERLDKRHGGSSDRV